jgi:4-amino-4-deoxy-L-arabinose transferase-like glycosyltransferase
MKFLKKYSLVLILIFSLFVGIFFRFYKLGITPRGFYLDEAAMGYNAYSILQTGKDEYGKVLPLIFRSFGDFKTPIYTYLIVPLIPVFGLSVFATRLPSAIFGVLTLFILFLLVKTLSPQKYAWPLSVMSALFLAISPWHIIFSRTAYETNVALFFLLLGAYLFIKALNKKWLFLLSSFAFAISFLAYHAERLVAPVILLALIIHYHQILFTNIKTKIWPIALSIIAGLLIVIPTVLLMRTPGFLSRTTTLNIFSYTHRMPPGYVAPSNLFQKIINTPQLLSAKEFSSLYISYFSPRYLFSIGDAGPRSSYPDLGTFFVWQLPLYLVGLYFLIKDKKLSHLRYFILVLLLVSPLPAALTSDPYTTIRSLPMVIPLVIIFSLGLVKILEFTWPVFNKLKYVIIGILVVYSVTRMYLSIFYFNDYFRATSWDYGWQTLINDFADLDPSLPIVVDNSRGEPYIHLLFFLKYDPAAYQKDNFEVSLTEYYTNMTRNLTKHIGNITVKGFEWGKDTDHIHQYIVSDGTTISDQQIEDHHMTKINQVNFPNGSVAFQIIETNPKPQ